MKHVLGICWMCILVTNLLGQNLNETLALADSTLAVGLYKEAESYYRRVLFFDKERKYDLRSIEGLAWSSYYIGEYDQASKYFKMLARISNEEKYDVLSILGLIKQGKFLDAKRNVLSMRANDQQELVNKKILQALIDFYLRDFEASQKNIEDISSYVGKEHNEDLFGKVQMARRKKKMVAIALSSVVPGLGHVYSHHVKEGINSFVVVAGFGVLYVYMATTFGLVDAIISVLPWFHRYYVGGLTASASLVDEYKNDKFLELYNLMVGEYGKYIEID